MRTVANNFRDVERYVLDHYYPHLSKSRDQNVRSLFRRRFHAAPWYNMPLARITSQEIAGWYNSIKAKHPQEANHCLATFRVCWKQAQIGGLIHEWQLAPGRLLKKTPAISRARFVTTEEMPRLNAAIDATHAPLRCFLTLLLETACRTGELLAAQWPDFDLDRGLWHKPTTKNGQPHTVPLSARALLALHSLDRTTAKPCPYSKPWYQIRWMELRQLCGLADVTFHDLRRTKATWEAAAGMPLPELQRLLGHKSYISTQPYMRQFANLAPLRDAMERTSAAMMERKAVGMG